MAKRRPKIRYRDEYHRRHREQVRKSRAEKKREREDKKQERGEKAWLNQLNQAE